MDNKDNYLITPEATNEPGTNFDDILNNAPTAPPVPVPEEVVTAKANIDRLLSLTDGRTGKEKER